MPSLGKLVSFSARTLFRLASRVSSLQHLATRATAIHHAAGRSRWYLLLKVIPKILVCLLARVVINVFKAWGLHLDFFSPELVSGLAQSAIFVLAILVSGVMEVRVGAR